MTLNPAGLSAMMYIAAACAERRGPTTHFQASSREWISSVSTELSEVDSLTALGDFRWLVRLADTNEEKATRLARLLKNTFQLTVSRKGTDVVTISVVIFNPDGADLTDVLLHAKRQALGAEAGDKSISRITVQRYFHD